MINKVHYNLCIGSGLTYLITIGGVLNIHLPPRRPGCPQTFTTLILTCIISCSASHPSLFFVVSKQVHLCSNQCHCKVRATLMKRFIIYSSVSLNTKMYQGRHAASQSHCSIMLQTSSVPQGLRYLFKASFSQYIATRVRTITLITQIYQQLKRVYDVIAGYILTFGPESWSEANSVGIDDKSLVAVTAWQNYISTWLDVCILMCLTNSSELTSF